LSRTRDREILEALLEVHRRLELHELLRVLLNTAREWCGARAGFLYRIDEAGVRLMPTESVPEGEGGTITVPGGIDRKEAEDLLAGRDEASWADLGPFAGGKGSRKSDPNAVALPVTGSDGTFVTLLLLLDVPEPDDASRERIHTLLKLAAPAVDNAVRVDSMKELIIMDDTADCFNRRHFEESFPEELSRATRFRSSLSLIFFDLDNLKTVNSNHGHSMGSRTLFEVSVRVKSKIRKFDKLFRFGGDEFCILLPETEWHGALEVAERVRESIAGQNFLVGRISVPAGVKVTASFGIASYPLHARTKEDIILRADRAMQRIKSGTKNSIAIAEIIGDDHES
jgi:diguanylate cyclase (GGDEF)-like protein